MKKILFTLCLIILTLAAFAQNRSCCAKPEGMAVFASNTDFQAAHLAPTPFNFENGTGKMMEYKTPDGKTASAYHIPSKEKTNKVLLVFHEWWGLNDYIKQEAEEWQKALGNVEVYALDLYDGKLGTTPDEAGKLMQGLDGARAEAIVKGLLNQIGNKKEIATVGWCMGGSWSFNAAVLAGKQAKACVMYYGFPETDKTKLAKINSDILFIQGTQDGFISNDLVLKFEADLKEVGKKIKVEQYAADHAFANPSNPKHNKEFSADAFAKSVRYIKAGLDLK